MDDQRVDRESIEIGEFVVKAHKVKRRKVRIARLEEGKTAMKRKLSDPKDKDDPRWVKGNIAIVENLIEKKTRSLEHKQGQREGNRKRRVTKE